MRKLPTSMENPLSNLFIHLADDISPVLRRTGHTPNLITLYSGSSAAAALLALHHGHVGLFAGLWMLHPFWDTVDGHYARKYGMTTKLGDMLDHTTDVAAFVGLCAVVWHRYDLRRTPLALKAALAATLLLFFVHLGCQQRHMGGGGGETLDALQPLCLDTAWTRITRWFGHGTWHVLVVLAVLYMERCCKRDSKRHS